MKGFYVPDSVSSSYVANKRTENGTLLYEGAANDVGLSKQQGVQAIEKNYAQTIENAYSSYLAAGKSVLGSNMGQGYKEAYLAQQDQQLQQGIAEANMNAATYRQELGTQEAQAQQQITAAFQTEVGNFDRAAASMNDYLAYVKSLTSQDGANTYLTEEYANLGVDELYHVLFNAQPQGFVDVEGNAGMNFLDWTRSKLGSSSSDEAYRQWFYGQGGYQELRTQLSAKSEGLERERQLKKAQEEEAARQRELAEKKAQEQAQQQTNAEATAYKVSSSKDGNTNFIVDGQVYGDYGIEGNVDDDLGNKLTEIAKSKYGDKLDNNVVVMYNGDYYRRTLLGKWKKQSKKPWGKGGTLTE